MSAGAIALTLPGLDVGTWQVRHRADRAAAALANRHYSRERRSHQVGGPSYLLVLVTPCERAVWLTTRHAPETKARRVLADGLDALRCAMFRNEGAGLSSELILAAEAVTYRMWSARPRDGWATYVDTRKVRSRNPGACFKAAGWYLDRDWSHSYLVRLRKDYP